MLLRLMGDEEGATAIEYGLIVAFIALAAVMAFTSLGLTLASVFENIGAVWQAGNAAA